MGACQLTAPLRATLDLEGNIVDYVSYCPDQEGMDYAAPASMHMNSRSRTDSYGPPLVPGESWGGS